VKKAKRLKALKWRKRGGIMAKKASYLKKIWPAMAKMAYVAEESSSENEIKKMKEDAIMAKSKEIRKKMKINEK